MESDLGRAETFNSEHFQTLSMKSRCIEDHDTIQGKYHSLKYGDFRKCDFYHCLIVVLRRRYFMKSVWKTSEMNVSELPRSLSKDELLTPRNKKVRAI